MKLPSLGTARRIVLINFFNSSSKFLQGGNLLKLGKWRIDTAANELIANGQRRRLTPKAMRALELLVLAGHQVVERRTLVAEVGLSDEGLSRVVNEIREALHDDARSPTYIETIPRRGYRLLPQRPFRGRPELSKPLIGLAIALGLLLLAVAALIEFPRSGDAMDVSIGTTTRLTAFEGAASNPVISGDQVWFIRRDALGGSGSGHRVSMTTLEMNPSPPIDGPGSAGMIAPFGDRVATLSEHGGDCRLTVSGGGLSEPRTTDCLRANGTLDWSPDGSAIVFELPRAGIGELSLADGTVRHLTDPPEGFDDLNPRFDPAGQRVSFTRSDGVVGELQLLTLGQSSAVVLTADNQMVFDHAWIDADRIVMSSDRSGWRQLWALRLSTNGWTDLGHGGAMRLDYRAPDLVFERNVYRADIEVWDGHAGRTVVDSERYDNHPRLSPDGRNLAFVSNRSGASALWVCGADGAEPRMLLTDARGRITRPYWLDHERLAYVVYEAPGSHARAADLNGVSKPLIPAEFAPREVVADAAGSVVFLGQDSAGGGLFRLVGRQAKLLARGDFRRLETDAEGRYYVMEKHERRILRFDHSARLTPVAEFDPSVAIHWTVAGDWLFFVTPDGLIRQSLSTGVRNLTGAPIPDTIGLGLSASADGQRVYVARFHGWQGDLMHAPLTMQQHK